jgi:L,D-transpeptidase catalytic domain
MQIRISTRPSCRVLAVSSRSDRSYAVIIRRVAEVRARPGAGRLVRRFSRLDENGYPVVLGVLGERMNGNCRATWYRVQVPMLPNGQTGWVAARNVRAFAVRTRIVVDLSTRRLVAYRAGRAALRAPVSVGAARTPTPVGRYFIDERFVLSDPNGPFGVAALGISAHSDVLRDWVQNGPIALHGTDDPASIGRAASHGCIRLENSMMQRLFALAPAGTPVVIHA